MMRHVGGDIHAMPIRLRGETARGLIIRVGHDGTQTVISRPEAERLIADLTALLTETPVEASLLTGGRA